MNSFSDVYVNNLDAGSELATGNHWNSSVLLKSLFKQIHVNHC